jgi:DNA (cytosine-5)-methyltransferase 1
MEKLTSDQSRMSYQPTLLDLTDAISLPGSESGTMPSTSQDGKDQSGQALVRASLSARQAKEKGLLTSGTYGLRGSTLSKSADRTHSLANRYSSKDGRVWLDLVSSDLEGIDYTIGTLDIPVCSVGAPHRRQRFFWVADSEGSRRRIWDTDDIGQTHGEVNTLGDNRKARIVADAASGNTGAEGIQRSGEHGQRQKDGCSSPLAHPEGAEQSRHNAEERRVMGHRSFSNLENTDLPQSSRFGQHGGQGIREQESTGLTGAGPTNGFWRDAEWIYCRDEKYRPTKPGIFPLVNGATGRVALLRGAGNAISPWVAKAFIESVMDKR